MSEPQTHQDPEVQDLLNRWPGPSVEELRRLEAEVDEHFWRTQVAATREGRDSWFLEEHLVPTAEWTARGTREWWVPLRSTRLPGARVLVRLGRTPDGLACTGLLVERPEGEVTARDLREINLRPLLDVALVPMRALVGQAQPATRPARPGRVGYDLTHWRDVYERYLHAHEVDRRRFVQVMLADYPASARPSEATMRRWVRKVEALLESGDLP